ncbi:MAG TPA: hypothetical protein VF739_14210, partial [Ktedonobacterales bacterium]
MRLPRLSVPLLTQLPRAPFISRRTDPANPDASDARHPRASLSRARQLRRQRRLARHQRQRSPILAVRETMRVAMRETVFSRPIWRI